MKKASKKKRPPAWHFFRVRGGSISLGSKARHAIKEAQRLGASGRELRFALKTIQSRVIERGREMRSSASTYQMLEKLAALNKAFGTDAATKRVIDGIKAERRKVNPKEAGKTGSAPKKPSIVFKSLRPELAKMIKGVISFGRDPKIATRHATFQNLMNATRKPECVDVCQWLSQTGDYYLHKARQTRSYSEYADLMDFVLRCYGAEGHLYGKFGFERNNIESQKKSYALIARLGLA